MPLKNISLFSSSRHIAFSNRTPFTRPCRQLRIFFAFSFIRRCLQNRKMRRFLPRTFIITLALSTRVHCAMHRNTTSLAYASWFRTTIHFTKKNLKVGISFIIYLLILPFIKLSLSMAENFTKQMHCIVSCIARPCLPKENERQTVQLCVWMKRWTIFCHF